MLLPGQTIEIRDPKVREGIGIELGHLIDDYERRYSPLFADIKTWWRNYEAVPNTRSKNWPFANASNVIVPLAQLMTDTMVARTHATIFAAGPQVWSARTENHHHLPMATNMVDYINWQADGNDFDFELAIQDWLLELVAIGSSVIAGNWREDIRHVFSRQGRGKQRRIHAEPVRFARGPLLEHVPREQVLWDTGYTIGEAPAVIRELAMSWSEIAYRATGNDWYMESVESIRGDRGSNSPGQQVREEKRQHDSQARGGKEPYDIRECHVDWPTMLQLGFDSDDLELDEAPLMSLVGVQHRKSRKLLHLKAEPYFVPYKPFFDGFYRKRSGRGHSVGLVKRLEGLQLAMTTIFNQGIDAQTRANAIFAKTRTRRHLEQPIDMSHPIYDPEGGFETLQASGVSFSNFQLLQVAQAMAERATGQADPAFGRETRLGGHPAPATSTLALMANADLLSGPMRAQLRRRIGRMGEFVASLDQQFEADEDGKIERVMGPLDAQHMREYLFPTEPIPGNYQFNVRGLSQDLNPEAQMQRAVVVSNMNQAYWGFVLRATQAIVQLSQAQLPPPIKQVVIESWAKSIQSQTEVHAHFLEAAEVDDVERFTLALQTGERDAGALARGFAERAASAAGAPGGAAQPGVARAPLLSAGGAAGTNGGTPPPGLSF